MSLLPAQKRLSAWRGGTFRKVLTLYMGETPTPGEERNLTGYTAKLLIKDESTVLLEVTDVAGTNGDVLTLGGPNGTIEIFISDETTAAASWTAGTYELTITGSNGDTDPLLYGSFSIQGI